MAGHDTLKTRKTLNVKGKSYDYFSIVEAEKHFGSAKKLPKSLKVSSRTCCASKTGARSRPKTPKP
jgi:aconitase A